MDTLLQKKCVACEGGTPPLTREEAQGLLAQVPGWTLKEDRIERHFRFKDFPEAMAFVNRLAEVAERENHHPDIHIYWNKLHLEFTTHAIHGLSDNDFIMAAKVNALPGAPKA